jgi:diguanylate cyclase (GGDEF)-like protein
MVVMVDDFKMITDRTGHAVGDNLLSNLTIIFKENTRGTDVVTRWEGELNCVLPRGF